MRATPGTAVVLAMAVFAGCDDPAGNDPPGTIELEEAFSFPELPPEDFLTHFAFDDGGVLWVATFGGTILRVSGDETTSSDVATVLGEEGRPNDLFVDALGRAWVTAGQSLAVFEDGAWTDMTPPSLMGLHPRIAEVAVNEAGEILLGAGAHPEGGLLLFRDGSWQLFTPDDSPLPSPITLEIAVGNDGDFWVGSGEFDRRRGGLTHVEDGQITAVFTRDDGLLYNYVDDIAIRGSDVYLAYDVMLVDGIGPDGGLQRLSPESGAITTWLPASTGLTSSRVRSVTTTSAGYVWFVTSLDGDPFECTYCASGIGVIDPSGEMSVLSTFNSDLAPNEFLPQIGTDPDERVHVLMAERRTIVRARR